MRTDLRFYINGAKMYVSPCLNIKIVHINNEMGQGFLEAFVFQCCDM